MPEELFSSTELTEIINEVQKAIYSKPNIIHLETNKTSVVGVSQLNGLIMAYGNADTGFRHIYERHSQASRIPHWNEEAKIGNPTKFALSLAPIDYLYVASMIFNESNVCLDKNKRSDLFDLYIGKYHHKRGGIIEYKLLVYKNSKVIHTLFVNENSKPFNHKKFINLKQGWPSGNHDLSNNIQTFTFLYYDIDEIEQFKVVIRYHGNTKQERWYIQVNPINERPFLTAFIKEKNIKKSDQFLTNLFSYEHEDVSWVEKIIKRMLNGSYKY